MYFFTADQHYGHQNIIRFCDRPFSTVEEMDAELVKRHNEVVGEDDTVIHAGDFAFRNARSVQTYIDELCGRHIFVRGSHDRWMDETVRDILELKIEDQFLVVCHYALRTWPRSHFNSWQLHGHSHGQLEPVGKQWDVGVDNNDYYPVSFERIREIMAGRPDNEGLVRSGRRG